MKDGQYPASADLIIDMEEAGIGVEEILQYAGSVLTRQEIAELRRGLKKLSSLKSIQVQDEERDSEEPADPEALDAGIPDAGESRRRTLAFAHAI